MPKSTQGTHICSFDHTMTEKLLKARDQAGYSWDILESYKLCLVHKMELERRGYLITPTIGGSFQFRWLVVWDVHPGTERTVIDLAALDEELTSCSLDE